MDEKIFVNLWYDINKDTFQVKSNAKDPKEIVNNFLRTQIGAGRDDSEPSRQDVYQISLVLDLTEDTFVCGHDCGNLGLRDGILMKFTKTKKSVEIFEEAKKKHDNWLMNFNPDSIYWG